MCQKHTWDMLPGKAMSAKQTLMLRVSAWAFVAKCTQIAST